MKPEIRIAPLLLALLALLCGCGLNKPPENMLRYDLSGAPGTLDPQYADSQSELEIISNSFEGLTAVSETGEVTPACAESWSISDGEKRYTFTLRGDIKWANGDPVTAGDFVFGLRRLFNPAAFSPAAGSYLMIKNAREILGGGLSAQRLGVYAASDRELVIELEYADPSLLTMLSLPAASPCHQEFFEEQKGKYGLSAKSTLCNGPFTVDSWGEDYVVMAKNPQYRGNVSIDGVNMYINRGDSLLRFLDGKSDVCLVPFYRLNEAGQLTGDTFYDQSWVMILNPRSEALSSEEVRASLIAVLDVEQRLEGLPEYLKPYGGIIAPDTMIGGVSYRDIVSLPKAAALPGDARTSFLSALDGMGKNDVGKMSVIVSDFEPGPQLGGDFQRLWQQRLSAFINMEQLEYLTLLRRVAGGDFDIAIAPLLSQSGSPIDCLALFESLEGSVSAPLSQLLSSARQQTDAEKAAERLLLAEQYLIDQYIVVPLFAAPSLFTVGEGVSGVYYNEMDRTVYFAGAVCNRD